MCVSCGFDLLTESLDVSDLKQGSASGSVEFGESASLAFFFMLHFLKSLFIINLLLHFAIKILLMQQHLQR